MADGDEYSILSSRRRTRITEDNFIESDTKQYLIERKFGWHESSDSVNVTDNVLMPSHHKEIVTGAGGKQYEIERDSIGSVTGFKETKLDAQIRSMLRLK